MEFWSVFLQSAVVVVRTMIFPVILSWQNPNQIFILSFIPVEVHLSGGDNVPDTHLWL